MSFPRAKIQRFNDATGCSPAPGSYNPKYDTKITGIGAVIEKSERFNEKKSSSSDLLNTSFKKASSLNNLATFRTPHSVSRKKRPIALKPVACEGLPNLKGVFDAKEENLEEIISQQNEQLSCLNSELEVYQREVKYLSAQLVEREANCDAVQYEMKQLQAAIVDKDSQMMSLGTSSEKDRVKFNNLIIEMEDQVKKSFHDLLEMRDQHLRMSLKIEESTALIEMQEITMDTLEKSNNLLAIDLQDKCEQIRNQLSINENLSAEMSTLSSANNKLEKDLSEFKESLILQFGCRNISEISERYRMLEEEIDSYQNCEKEKNESICKLEGIILANESCIQNLREEIDYVQLEVQSEKVILEDKMADMTFELAALAKAKERVELDLLKHKEGNFILENKLDIQVTEVADLKHDLEKLSSEYTELAYNLEMEKMQLKDETVCAIGQIIESVDKLRESYSKQLEDNYLNAQMLEENIINSSLIREQFESDNKNKESELSNLKDIIKVMKYDFESMISDQVKAADNKYNELVFELLETRSKFDLAKIDMAESEKDRVELQAQVTQLLEEKVKDGIARDSIESLCKKYEIVNANLHESLRAVIQRLNDTSRDFEIQLKQICILKEIKANLEDTVAIHADVLRVQEQSMSDIETEYTRKAEDLCAQFHTDIDKLVKANKAHAMEANETAERKYEEKFQALLIEINSEKQLAQKAHDSIVAANNMQLEQVKVELGSQTCLLESKIKELEEAQICIADLQFQMNSKEEQLAVATEFHDLVKKQMKEEHKIVLTTLELENSVMSKKCQKALAEIQEKEKSEERNNEWEERYNELASLVGPFRQQLQDFESERQGLESRNEAAVNEMRDLSLKYAHILGHQNHKQKINHVVKLKEHNLELKQVLEKSEAENRQKDKIIKKLKTEIALQTCPAKARLTLAPLVSKGKENTSERSPAHSPNVYRKVPKN